MSRRALLTEREREVLAGEADDVENPEAYRQKVRSRVTRRLDRLEEDAELLEEVAPEVASDLHSRICEDGESRLARLEREVANLREKLEYEKD